MVASMAANGKSETGGYSMGAACRRLGIGPHTLRAWEGRYAAVQPARSGSGRRRYSEKEVERLETLVRLVNLGHAIGFVASLSNRALQELLQKSVAKTASTGALIDERFLSELRLALEKFDVRAVSSLLDQRRTALEARRFVLQVMGPLLRWIGLSVARGRLSTAHEHALSAVLKDQISQVLRCETKPRETVKKPRFVLATPEDDLHEFGVLLASALAVHHGFPSHFLGADLPAEALSIAVAAVQGDVVVLGNAPVPPSQRAVSFEAYLCQVHQLLRKDVEIWIGGAGTVPHLRRVMPGRRCRLLNSLDEFDSLLAEASTASRQ